jgi:hypothetical protein
MQEAVREPQIVKVWEEAKEIDEGYWVERARLQVHRAQRVAKVTEVRF